MPVEHCLMPTKALAEGCVILEVPADKVVIDRRGCVYSRPVEYAREYGLHKHTVQEELKTLTNRHLFETPTPQVDSEEWKEFLVQARTLARQIGRVPRAKFTALLGKKNGRKLKRYWGGINKYLRQGLTKKDSRITEMQKLEFYERSKIAEKEDRGIQFRSTQYNAALASHLHNVEERLIHLHDGEHRIVMKGLKPDECMKCIACGTEDFKDPVFLCFDHARFDAHVHWLLLLVEYMIYYYCRRGNPEMMRYLFWQLSNIGYSFGGIKYMMRGKRMSGDVNTGLGNTLLNLCMLRALLAYFGIKGRVFLNGDDSVVICEREDAKIIMDNYKEFFAKLGMKTEGEMVDDLFKAEFCQNRPCWIDGELKSVRDPMKVISTVGQSGSTHDEQTMREVVKATCLCEFALNGTNCPVISPYVKRVYNTVENARVMLDNRWRYKVEAYNLDIMGKTKIPEPAVSESSRYYFWRSWGIDPGEQIMIENQLIEQQVQLLPDRKEKVKNKVEEYPLDWTWGTNVVG